MGSGSAFGNGGCSFRLASTFRRVGTGLTHGCFVVGKKGVGLLLGVGRPSLGNSTWMDGWMETWMDGNMDGNMDGGGGGGGLY